jgi:hypothetical protein
MHILNKEKGCFGGPFSFVKQDCAVGSGLKDESADWVV